MTEVLVKEEVQDFKPSVEVKTPREKTCKERVKGEYRKECERLTSLFSVMYQEATQEQMDKFSDFFGRETTGEPNVDSEMAVDALCNYGLSIEYVLPGSNKGRGFLRWLVSWGGPSDEWRFYFVPGENKPYRIEYIYSDWFDSAKVVCTKGRVANLLWDWLNDVGTPDYEYNKAHEDSEEY